jgi:hypothetical protein
MSGAADRSCPQASVVRNTTDCKPDAPCQIGGAERIPGAMIKAGKAAQAILALVAAV